MVMQQNVKCFFVKRNGHGRRFLRRFVFPNRDAKKNQCSGTMSYHNAMVFVDTIPYDLAYNEEYKTSVFPNVPPPDNPQWPMRCECGYEFTEADEKQVFMEPVYVDERGNEYGLRDHVPGMMWNAEWLAESPAWRGPDGMSLIVVCPDGHEWTIDGRASNCTLPDDSAHRCWVRHGTPPNITVDKNGNTCGAGAGSIQTPGYHGFLVNGVFNP